MHVEFIAWAYAPTLKQTHAAETEVQSYEGFKKRFFQFWEHLQDLKDTMNLSGVIETRVIGGTEKDKNTLAMWRAQAADELFVKELTKEEEYA